MVAGVDIRHSPTIMGALPATMSFLARLRHTATGLLGRMVLAWFALTLGVATGAPLVHPTALQVVCTGTGSATLLLSTEGTAPGAGHLDCPLCLPTVAPPPACCAAPRAAPVFGHLPRPAADTLPYTHGVLVPPARAPPLC